MLSERRFIAFAVTILSVLTCNQSWAADGDSCLALIPKTGAFSIQLSTNSSKSFDSSKAWFCSDDFVSYATQAKSSGGISVPIDGVPVSGSFDTANANNMALIRDDCPTSVPAMQALRLQATLRSRRRTCSVVFRFTGSLPAWLLDMDSA